ncbi:MAG: type IV toxin-antitoxin system AbiEi family antitoxin domain-containing protein [Simkaniaceae bacterium]|nr:type IV toxin-antitoxin system AbiEi family antitoxin domain-containing protein [Simkaniaceae bacterium]
MGSQNQLFEIADRQQGYFTAKQAEVCGFRRSNFHFKLHSGEWVQEARGIYRLGRYPTPERPELVLWSLWSRNIKDSPQGVWSHETALDIHELSDVMPSKMNMTVPLNFRRRKDPPKLLRLHRANLKDADIEERQGYKVTTPLRTIIDCITDGKIADNFILQALQQGLNRGLFLEKELEAFKETRPEIYEKIRRVLR